jgi:hypothetical protein
MSELQKAYQVGEPAILTEEQVRQIMEAVKFVCVEGFGKVTILIEKGHPALIGVETTNKLVSKGVE